MHLFRSFLRAGAAVGLFIALPCAIAQDANSTTTPTSGDSPASGNTASDLFPAGGVQSSTPGPHGTSGSGHRNGGGNHRRNGRQHEQLVGQADADPLEVRVAYRRAKTIALARDPGLATLIHQAAAAPTDIDKHAYLKEYYTRLFASVCKVDSSPEMKKHVELLDLIARQRYDPKRREVGGDEDLVNGRGRGRRGRVE